MKSATFIKMIVIAAMSAVCLGMTPVATAATVVYNLNFDHGYQYGADYPPEVFTPTSGPQYYLPGAGEVAPSGVWSVLLSFGGVPGFSTGNIVASTGPQGGKALEVDLGGSWPNKQGLYCGRDTGGAAPDGSYGAGGDITYPGYPNQKGGSSAGSTISDNYTVEAVVQTDFRQHLDFPFGLTSRATIYDSIRQDKTDGAALWVDQWTGDVGFALGNGSSLTVAAGLQTATWYDIKAVVNSGLGIQLYVDGVLLGTAAYPTGGTSLPGYFTLGTSYWNTASQNWQGQIDNFMIASEVAVPEPTSLGLVVLGATCLMARSRLRKAAC